MKYLLLIYEKEGTGSGLSEAERGKIYQEYMDYTKRIRKTGNYVAGEALQPISTATTVRVKDGKTLTTDGPFAETREPVKLATGIPAVRTGSIEVRPIQPFHVPD
jgi:hypothetical protein